MKYFELYTGDKTYVSAASQVYTSERVVAEYPAALTIPHVVETDSSGAMILGFDTALNLANQYQIDISGMTPSESVIALANGINAFNETQRIAEEEAAAAEQALKDEQLGTQQSIAWNLEYQNLINS